MVESKSTVESCTFTSMCEVYIHVHMDVCIVWCIYVFTWLRAWCGAYTCSRGYVCGIVHIHVHIDVCVWYGAYTCLCGCVHGVCSAYTCSRAWCGAYMCSYSCMHGVVHICVHVDVGMVCLQMCVHVARGGQRLMSHVFLHCFLFYFLR